MKKIRTSDAFEESGWIFAVEEIEAAIEYSYCFFASKQQEADAVAQCEQILHGHCMGTSTILLTYLELCLTCFSHGVAITVDEWKRLTTELVENSDVWSVADPSQQLLSIGIKKIL